MRSVTGVREGSQRTCSLKYDEYSGRSHSGQHPINLVISQRTLLKMKIPHSHFIDRKWITRYFLVQRKIQIPTQMASPTRGFFR
ncbi:Uncharacterised protein [Yersinia aldovae]|nr:Uncharacterised protein [Yersinia aldovae]